MKKVLSLAQMHLLYEELSKNKAVLGYGTRVIEESDGTLSVSYKGELVAQVYFTGAVRLILPKKVTRGLIERYNKLLNHLRSYVNDIQTDTISGQFVMTPDDDEMIRAKKLKDSELVFK